MPRRRSSTADDFTEIIAKLPWWACIGIALGTYLLFSHWAAQPVTGSAEPGQLGALVVSQLKQSVSSVLRYLVPLFCLVAAVVSWAKRNKPRR